MANDKDFLLKNAVEVGGPTKVTLGTVTNNDIDLATGNYFADTPSGASTYTISNAGDVQSFQLEVTGGTAEILQNFSTTLYTGNGSTQTITNGIDLANDGGLIWTKIRDQTGDHALMNSESSWLTELASNKTDAEGTTSYVNFVDNSNGYSMNTAAFRWNENTREYVSWTFKKEPSFFDVVTWTGDGTTGRAISHNLGCEVGAIFVKTTSGSSNWYVYNRNLTSANYGLKLNGTDAEAFWGTGNVTDTTFSFDHQNGSGNTYVAYLFAHDDAADGLIQCGSYVSNETSPPEINLGWKPQWILIKKTTGVDEWAIFDNVRGVVTGGNDFMLRADTTQVEYSAADQIDFTSTGFKLTTAGLGVTNAPTGETYVYMAIREPSDPDITWPSSIEWAGGIAPSAPAVGETDVFTLSTDDGGTSYVGVKTADNLS